MGTEEGIVQISVASVVEDVLQQGKRLSDIDLASRKAEEACMYLLFHHVNHFFCINSFISCYECFSI